jgi:asparagine synthase (glutamine-hydrolysing)
LTELAEAGRWRELGMEVEAWQSRNQQVSTQQVSTQRVLKHYGIPILRRRAQKGQWLRLWGDTNEIAKHFHLSHWNLLYRHGIRPAISASLRRIDRRESAFTADTTLYSPFLDTSFVRRMALVERIRRLSGVRLQPASTERQSHWNVLTTGLLSHVLEKMDSLAAPFGLDVRHPFMDKRLIQFCLALPPEQKRNQGWDRLILRRAMTNILPSEVQWRAGKADFTTNFIGGLTRYDRSRLDTLLLKEELCVSQFVNVGKVRDFYGKLTATNKDPMGLAIQLWLIVVLELWLRHSDIHV